MINGNNIALDSSLFLLLLSMSNSVQYTTLKDDLAAIVAVRAAVRKTGRADNIFL